jgi:hypothetical protein
MHIVDMEGQVIHVTDLDAAIRQADIFRQYRHTDEKYHKLDNTLAAYWNHIYEQLVQLKN